MLNFLFGLMCASGAIFGILLTYSGVAGRSYDSVIAGGIFLFGSLLTFGVGQINRSIGSRQKEMKVRNAPRDLPPRTEPALGTETPRAEPAVFPAESRPEPIIPHPVLERVASRFARPER